MDSASLYYPQRIKIVTGRVMAEIDRVSIHERGIPGSRLMQHAGESIAKEIITTLSESAQHPVIICGKGNNGGDGFVIANYLSTKGAFPTLILLTQSSKVQGDALFHFQLSQQLDIPVVECETESDVIHAFQHIRSTIYVDAMLGTGTQGAPRGLMKTAINELNKNVHTPVVSVDISSGVNADTGAVDGEAVIADFVYSIGLPKVGHSVLPGLDYFKNLKIVEIGFPHDLLDQAVSEADWLTPQQINHWLPKRDVSSYKGSEGHLLVLAGSKNMPGAAMMCVKAAALSGSGLVTLACPESIHVIMAQQVWEKMTLPVAETEEGSFSIEAYDQLFQGNHPYTAIVIGPGLSRHPSTLDFVRMVFKSVDIPILVDGDGIFALSLDMLKAKKGSWVITPHPGEMARLFDTSSKEIQSKRWHYAKEAVKSSNGVCVLKGPKTVISRKDDILYINPTGNPAMASGGMGDVLSGIIGGLIARGLEPLNASCSGAYIHGYAADLLVKETNVECICATDVASHIQKSISEIRKEAGTIAA